MTQFVDPKRLSDLGKTSKDPLSRALQQARQRLDYGASMDRIKGRLPHLMQSKATFTVPPETSVGANGSPWVYKILSIGIGLSTVVGLLLLMGQHPDGQKELKSKKELTPSSSEKTATPSSLKPPPPTPQPEGSTEKETLDSIPALSAHPRSPARRAKKKRVVPPPLVQPPDPALELQLLKRAQHSLDREPKRTLELTEQHKQLYPQGIFAQEREMLAVESLLKMDERDEAFHRAQRFQLNYPRSAHIRRIENLFQTIPKKTHNSAER